MANTIRSRSESACLTVNIASTQSAALSKNEHHSQPAFILNVTFTHPNRYIGIAR